MRLPYQAPQRCRVTLPGCDLSPNGFKQHHHYHTEQENSQRTIRWWRSLWLPLMVSWQEENGYQVYATRGAHALLLKDSPLSYSLSSASSGLMVTENSHIDSLIMILAVIIVRLVAVYISTFCCFNQCQFEEPCHYWPFWWHSDDANVSSEDS